MIDLKLLRDDTDNIKQKILKKEPSFAVDRLITLDQDIRGRNAKLELLRKEKNELAKQGSGGITPELREKSMAISKQLKQIEKELKGFQGEFETLSLSCPNILQDDVPQGNKESNRVVETVGEKKTV